MQVGMNVNKSFRFVKTVTSVVAQKGKSNIDPRQSQNIQEKNRGKLSPEQVQNKSRNGSIKTQARFSTQDRFINIVI
jgi:hypothetical protein